MFSALPILKSWTTEAKGPLGLVRVACLASSSLLFAFAANAQETQDSAEVRMATLLSQDFARQAREALERGNRSDAIVLALRGLPDDPSDEDFERYPDAADALLLAVHLRSVRIPVTEELFAAALSPDGSVMATLGAPDVVGRTPQVHGLELWDTQTGALLHELMPQDEAHGYLHAPEPTFSPDSQYIALTHGHTSQTVVFDVATGQRVVNLGDFDPRSSSGGPSPEFSPDGTRLLTSWTEPSMVHVWDTATWQRIASFGDGDTRRCQYMSPVRGGSGSALYFIEVSGCIEQVSALYRVDASGGITALARFEQSQSNFFPGFSVAGRVGPTEEYFFYSSIDGNTMVTTIAGEPLLDLHAGITGIGIPVIAGEGDAVIFPETIVPTRDEIVAMNVDGTRTSAELWEVLPALSMVYGEGGGVISMSLRNYFSLAPRTAPLQDRALYEFVWDNLPLSIREAVANDRVPSLQ